jgi:anti-sigma factor RsiW
MFGQPGFFAPINLTAVPGPGRANSAPVLSAANGYNMYRWAEDGVAYWAVSDVATADLDKLVTLFRTAPPDQ